MISDFGTCKTSSRCICKYSGGIVDFLSTEMFREKTYHLLIKGNFGNAMSPVN